MQSLFNSYLIDNKIILSILQINKILVQIEIYKNKKKDKAPFIYNGTLPTPNLLYLKTKMKYNYKKYFFSITIT